MTSLPERCYVDVNVFLNPILYKIDENEEAANSDLFLKKIISKEVEAYTSVLTWDEFVWVIRREMDYAIAKEKGRDFLVFPNLIFETVTYDIINNAQSLIETFSLKPRDAIHLATALNKKLTEIITLDDDFKGISIIQYRRP